ncbi:MAG: hypothetical protein WAU38_07510 [Ignavibacteria bacterium]
MINLIFTFTFLFMTGISFSYTDPDVRSFIFNERNDSLIKKNIKTDKKMKIKKDEKELSFTDKVQKLFEIRRTFNASGETTKPALLSFKKDNDENAVFNIDFALSYKGLRFEEYGVSPSVQFDYSSKTKDQLEKLKAGLDIYYKVYEYTSGSGRIEPAVSYSKDFFSKTEIFETGLSFIPKFPEFLIPVMNVSEIKFKYDGNDNRWIFGFNPVIAANFRRTYGGKNDLNLTEYLYSFAGGFTLRRYFLLFEIYGRYENDFSASAVSGYKYDGTATFYFDEKERSSLNARFEQGEKNNKQTKKYTIGFGIKL